MRTKTALSLISAAAIFASSAVAQEPADEQAMQQMHQRFESGVKTPHAYGIT
jgi:hypothetical protein